jgi:DNA-binding NtrC family response regulator
VDDEPALRFAIRDYFAMHGFETDEADSCGAADEAFRTRAPDAVVLDHRLPDGDALGLLGRLKSLEPELPVVVLTGHATIELAVKAIQGGADQFLTKPVDLAALHLILERLLLNRRARQKQAASSARPGRGPYDPFLGTSPARRALEEEARRALGSGSTILIEGETGSGKGVLAAWLHRNGRRRDEPFVDVNCAGLSRELLESELFGHERGSFTGASASKVGLLEVAHHGTVFLDEIGDSDPVVQAKILKVLEEKRFRRLGEIRDRHVDIHLIAATHHDLLALARERKFREDLYYRIGVLPLRVPPLRERREDLPALAAAILDGLAMELGRPRVELSTQAAAALAAHSWPGNVRELRNVLERAVLRAGGGAIGRDHLALDPVVPAIPAGPGLDLTLAEVERRHIERMLAAEAGHVERAAKRLGIPRSSLYQKIKQMGLSTRR